MCEINSEKVWIENARIRNWKQRSDYETGKFLRCPSKAKDGKERSYKIMREPNIGEAVIHFREDNIWGTKDETRIVGYSYVKSQCVTDKGGNFRIDLDGYKEFNVAVQVSELIKIYGDELKLDLEENRSLPYPFDKNLNFKQGGYLSRATPFLVESILLLSESLIHLGPADTAINHNVQKEYLEGRRLLREVKLFSRNPHLVRDVKAKAAEEGRLCCWACGFDFEETYGDMGAGYIECHHLTPLSERASQSDKEKQILTRLDDISLLCSNCHRMVHRPKDAIHPDELKRRIQSRKSQTP